MDNRFIDVDSEELVEFSDKPDEGDGFLDTRPKLENMKLSFIQVIKKAKLAKSDEQARKIIAAVSIIIFLLAVFIVFYYAFGIGRSQPTGYYMSM